MLNAASERELIPGYMLVERLGAGGYGEVWKVEAPGGLHKALKIIYGFVCEDRAARELKALNHLREVRHPFILSLERIEVVEGRLMIVTELAEGCLSDRYQACRANGLPGIPRDELLGYVRDTAEALDYMLQTHSLQHLDVKPENLLLVGGRAKVADFGLVKEIADQTRSLVGAMTPSYASPELFDGRASRQSDQYSLAIVYQELLTGTLPFPGKTAAQLAAQHTRSRAQVAALPPRDREIILRALSKTPSDRFATCCELVDNLARATPAAKPSPAQRDDARPPSHDVPRSGLDEQPAARTEMIAPGAAAVATERPGETAGSQRHRVRVGTEVVDVPTGDLSPSANCLRPALFVGAGGTGGLVLAKLRTRLEQRFGAERTSQAYPMLALETDAASIKQAARSGLDRADVASIFLRQAHEYRSEADQLLPWLGRRWLYNIPKSGQVSGIRAWGRLALVDHATSVVNKLRQRTAQLTNGSSAAALVPEGYDPECEGRPEIFLISSAGGGTGSGTVMELAYAIRNIMRRTDHPALRISLITSIPSRSQTGSRPLALANTLALLTELQHYARCGSQSSGRVETRLAMFEGDDFPLDEVYFAAQPDEPTSDAYDRHLAELAEYLFCRVATPLGAILHQALPTQSREQRDCDLHLRCFDVSRYHVPMLADDADACEQPAAVASEADESAREPITCSVVEQPDAAVDTPASPVHRLGLGCRRRQYLLVPNGADDSRLQLDRSLCPLHQRLETKDDAVTLCDEFEGISLAQLAAHIAGRDPQVREAVEHLHTRVDLTWTPPALVEEDPAASALALE